MCAVCVSVAGLRLPQSPYTAEARGSGGVLFASVSDVASLASHTRQFPSWTHKQLSFRLVATARPLVRARACVLRELATQGQDARCETPLNEQVTEPSTASRCRRVVGERVFFLISSSADQLP